MTDTVPSLTVPCPICGVGVEEPCVNPATREPLSPARNPWLYPPDPHPPVHFARFIAATEPTP